MKVNMPNPASVYCVQNENKLEISTAGDGSQSGVCVFPDGSTCDEWAYYRGTCGPALQKGPTPIMTVNATTEASSGSTEENASGGYMPPDNLVFGRRKTQIDTDYFENFPEKSISISVFSVPQRPVLKLAGEQIMDKEIVQNPSQMNTDLEWIFTKFIRV